VLVQLLGLNPQAFAKDRLVTFKKRIAKNFHHQLPFLAVDHRLIYNHGQILRTVGYDNPKSNAQYAAGLASSGIEHLKKLVRANVHITVVCGGKDELFPPREIQESLRENSLPIPVLIVGNTPHSPLPTKQGMRLFNRALEVTSVRRSM